MATLLTQGTLLEARKIKKPLTKSYLFSLSVLFFVCAHFFQPNPGGSGLHLAFNAASWIPASISIAIALFHTAKQGLIKYSTLTLVLLPKTEPLLSLICVERLISNRTDA